MLSFDSNDIHIKEFHITKTGSNILDIKIECNTQ